METKSTKITVDQLVAKTATGRDRTEFSKEIQERIKNVKPLVTKDEINAWLEERRRAWKQQSQQQ